MIRPTVGLRENFFVCYNVYLKNKNHTINAPWNTLSKPQYTLKKTHHRIPSSIQFQETAVWLCDTTQYFSRVCLELVPGFNAFRLCAVEYVLCDLIRKMCGCGIHNQFNSLPLLPFFNIFFDSKLLQPFRGKIAFI